MHFDLNNPQPSSENIWSRRDDLHSALDSLRTLKDMQFL